MSLSSNLVRSLFTIVAVGLSYDFLPQIESWLHSMQPNLSTTTLGFEAAALVVVPTLIFATLVIRQIARSRNP